MKTGLARIINGGGGIMIAAMFAVHSQTAASVNTAQQQRNWNVDGLNGVIQASGTLVSTPCVMMPESRYQEINMGQIVAGELQHPGDVTLPVNVHIMLDKCPGGPHRVNNRQRAGGSVWGKEQGIASIRLIGQVDPDDHRFFHINGTNGISLRIEDSFGELLMPRMPNMPVLLEPGRNDIVLKAQLWRNTSYLMPGEWRAVLNIGMEYE